MLTLLLLAVCREIKTLVLDEADEMLSKGFKEQIYDVYRYLPPETQVGAAVAPPGSILPAGQSSSAQDRVPYCIGVVITASAVGGEPFIANYTAFRGDVKTQSGWLCWLQVGVVSATLPA